MTPRYAKLDEKNKGLVNCQAEPVKPSAEINHALNLQYTVEVSVTQGLFIQESRRKVNHTVVG